MDLVELAPTPTSPARAFVVPRSTDAEDLEWYFTYSDGELAGYTSPLAQLQRADDGTTSDPGDVRMFHLERDSVHRSAAKDRRVRAVLNTLPVSHQFTLQAYYRDYRRQTSALRVHFGEWAGLVAWQFGTPSGPRMPATAKGGERTAIERKAAFIGAARTAFEAATAAYRNGVTPPKRWQP